MQVTETLSEGLKREYRIVVPAAELDTRVSARLEEMKDKVKINGFRPGKVPTGHLKRVYGRSAMAEVIDQTVNEATRKIVDENSLKLALEPKITLPEDEGEAQAVIEGKKDLDFSVGLEVLPTITLADFKGLTIEKMVAAVSDADVNESLERIARANAPFKAKDGAAEKGDKVTIDFVGTIDGVAFDGGTGSDMPVEIGAGGFIPGFEEQLVGVTVGDQKVVKVSFPEKYSVETLAGKPAEFAVTVKAVEVAEPKPVDEETAKNLGLESLDKLKEAVREQIGKEFSGVTRRRMKRSILDQLDKAHDFPLPQGLVDQEFDQVWAQVSDDLTRAAKTFEDEGTTEEKAREDYRKIAERRVRLGLVLAEIGEKNNIKVNDDEVGKALVERARQFPGQEKQVWDYYRNNPQALATLRAPIFEEKVIDFILELAKVTETSVPRDKLLAEEDADETAAVA